MVHSTDAVDGGATSNVGTVSVTPSFAEPQRLDTDIDDMEEAMAHEDGVGYSEAVDWLLPIICLAHEASCRRKVVGIVRLHEVSATCGAYIKLRCPKCELDITIAVPLGETSSLDGGDEWPMDTNAEREQWLTACIQMDVAASCVRWHSASEMPAMVWPPTSAKRTTTLGVQPRDLRFATTYEIRAIPPRVSGNKHSVLVHSV